MVELRQGLALLELEVDGVGRRRSSDGRLGRGKERSKVGENHLQ